MNRVSWPDVQRGKLRSPRTTERILPLRNEAHRHHHHTGARQLFDRIVALGG